VIKNRGSNLGRGTFFFPQSAALSDLLKMELEVQHVRQATPASIFQLAKIFIGACLLAVTILTCKTC